MVELNILEAVRDALDIELQNDPSVYLMGEDIGPKVECLELQKDSKKNMVHIV